VEEGELIKESTRKILPIGGSRGVTLPSDWVKFLEWLRKEKLTEVYCAMDEVIVLAPPDKKDKVRRVLERYEREEMMEEAKI